MLLLPLLVLLLPLLVLVLLPPRQVLLLFSQLLLHLDLMFLLLWRLLLLLWRLDVAAVFETVAAAMALWIWCEKWSKPQRSLFYFGFGPDEWFAFFSARRRVFYHLLFIDQMSWTFDGINGVSDRCAVKAHQMSFDLLGISPRSYLLYRKYWSLFWRWH